MGTAIKTTSIRLNARLADKAAKTLGVKSRTEAVHIALREIVALNKFKKVMTSLGGKLRFQGHGE
jgi:Arc/MetJ family transcription regulator